MIEYLFNVLVNIWSILRYDLDNIWTIFRQYLATIWEIIRQYLGIRWALFIQYYENEWTMFWSIQFSPGSQARRSHYTLLSVQCGRQTHTRFQTSSPIHTYLKSDCLDIRRNKTSMICNQYYFQQLWERLKIENQLPPPSPIQSFPSSDEEW